MYPNLHGKIHLCDSRLFSVDSAVYTIYKTIQREWNGDVRDFSHYLQKMEATFEEIRQGMDYTNLEATHHAGDDVNSVGWAGVGMMPIAAYLYYMKSKGVIGGVLECGVFKGGSTCCLSHICDYLGLKLFAADSFAGLPSGDDYYGQGDFKGSFAEVSDNMQRLGRPEAVTWIKGFFSDSLSGFSEPLMMIWLDVDLQQSVLDVLGNCYDNLVEGGVIFCDGLGKERDFDGEYLYPGSGESRGLVEFFDNNNISHKAVYSGYGYMGLVVPDVEKDEKLLYSHLLLHRILFATKSRREQFRIIFNRLRA